VLIGSVEVGLAELVRSHFAPDLSAVLDLIPKEAASEVQSRLTDAMRSDVDTDVVAYLDFAHLLKIVSKARPLYGALGYRSRHEWDDTVGALPAFRNRVMHSNRALLDEDFGLIRLRDCDAQLRQLFGRLSSTTVPLAELEGPEVQRA
jgi:hypothetical protein